MSHVDQGDSPSTGTRYRVILLIEPEHRIQIPQAFRAEFQHRRPHWGPIGEQVYMRTYSGLMEDGRRERWLDTVIRIEEGHFTLLKRQAMTVDAWWSDDKAQRLMVESGTRLWEKKWTPAGRGLQFMGTKTMEVKGGAVGMSCAFTSTKDICRNFTEPFCRMFDLLMLGVGVGFDDRGKGTMRLSFNGYSTSEVHRVEDTREGWTDALKVLLLSFVPGGMKLPTFDFGAIRPKGAKLVTIGGVASGPDPLIRMLRMVEVRLLKSAAIEMSISEATICDVMNLIATCVVSGGVRRSSQVYLGEATDSFMDLKNPSEWLELQRKLSESSHPHERQQLKDMIATHPLATHRWASNNSIFAHIGMNYAPIAERIAHNGEPGLLWLDDMVRRYGRLADPIDLSDAEAAGANPCQPAFATVLHKNGIGTFGDLNVGDVIWSGSQWTRVTHKVSTGIKPVFRYRTTAGSFIGTANHRVLEHGHKIQVQDAESIDTSQGPEVQATQIHPEDVMDGLMLGDGGWHEASSSNFLYQGEGDSCYDDSEIAHLLADRRAYGGMIWRKVASSILDPLPKTYERSIPRRFVTGGSEKVRGFLRGLFSANGSVVASRVTLKASSRSVIDDVQIMLSSIGIRSYITTNAAHDVQFKNGTYLCRESYDLNIGTRAGCSEFRRLVGFIHPYKNIKLAAICDAATSKYASGSLPKSTFDIVAVEYIGDLPVFDITVEADEHTYWTGGMLVSNCLEQQLHNDETCNLVELFMSRHVSLDDWLKTIKHAYLYGKAMTLAEIHDPKVYAIGQRNRRIGLSITGVAEMYERLGARELSRWLDTGYKEVERLDQLYSGWLEIPRSIRKTSLKPSGSVSTLPGVQGGIRFPEDLFYLRLVRFADTDPMWQRYADAGYQVEDDVAANNTKVVYFPVEEPGFQRTVKDVSLREQMSLGALVQKHWADNMVSATYMVHESELGQIGRVLEDFEGRLKCASFLPIQEKGKYAQMPYTTCTRAVFDAMRSRIKPVSYHENDGAIEVQKFCDGDSCQIR